MPIQMKRKQEADSCPDILHLVQEESGHACLASKTGDDQRLGSWGLVGLNHRTATIDIRSKVSLQGEERRVFLRTAVESGLEECVVLSTCNRTEIYYSGATPEPVKHALSMASGVPLDQLQPFLYTSVGVCGACHLVRVAAGLDSAVLGETEIVSQVKEAWQTAKNESATGPVLDLLFRKALEAGKRIRTQTELCRTSTSLAFLGVRRAEAVHGTLSGKSVAVLGAGQIAERTLKELATIPDCNVVVANRSVANAQRLIQNLEIQTVARDLTQLLEILETADVVFACLAAPGAIPAALLGQVSELRTNLPLTIVDFGVPPNVEPGFEADWLNVVDVDELREASDANATKKQEAIDPALQIVSDELDKFSNALVQRMAAPMIRDLVQHSETIVDQNVAWAKDRLAHLTPKDLQVVEQLAEKVARGMLEKPIAHLKTEPPGEVESTLIKRLFGLEGGPE